MEAQSAVASSVCRRVSRGHVQAHVCQITRTLVHVARLTWSGALIFAEERANSCPETVSGQALAVNRPSYPAKGNR